MISAPRIVVVSDIFFPMGLFYYSSDNGTDRTISARNPTAASAYRAPAPEAKLPRSQAQGPYPLEWTSKDPGFNSEGGTARGGRSIQCMGKCQCGRLKGNPCGPLRPNTINVTMPYRSRAL